MRVFESDCKKKSWCIKLEGRSCGDAFIWAVDSRTGEKITELIAFYQSGEVVTTASIQGYLLSKGYDPHEHGNQFNTEGRIVIKRSS